MDIKVLTTGCGSCHTLEDRLDEALDRIDVDATVETVDDMQDIMSYGIMSVPALMVDGEIVSAGDPPSVHDLTELLQSA